jgi:hypothetical protein
VVLLLLLLLLVLDAMRGAVLDVLIFVVDLMDGLAMGAEVVTVVMLPTWSSSAVLSAADVDALNADADDAVMVTTAVQSPSCRCDALFLLFFIFPSGLAAGQSSVLGQQSSEPLEVRDERLSLFGSKVSCFQWVLTARPQLLSPKVPAQSRMELPAEETAGSDEELKDSESCKTRNKAETGSARVTWGRERRFDAAASNAAVSLAPLRACQLFFLVYTTCATTHIAAHRVTPDCQSATVEAHNPASRPNKEV